MGTITTYDPWDDPPSRNSHSRPFCQQRIQAYFAARPPGGEWDIRDLKSMEEKPLVEYLLSGISTVMICNGSLSYQRKLGSNTSELRTNRILRLEMMKDGMSSNNT